MDSRKSDPRQIQLFQNKLLERLTKISFVGFATVWSLALACLLCVGWGAAPLGLSALLIAAGLAGWILFEYTMHRHLFHWQPTSAAAKNFVYLVHGNHHEIPHDTLRNMMPPVASMPIAAVIWASLVLALGPAGTWAFFGFIVGYVAYDITHYACHQWPMKSRFGRMMKRHHMQHHFVDEERNFAVTALFLDRIFGTKAVAASEVK